MNTQQQCGLTTIHRHTGGLEMMPAHQEILRSIHRHTGGLES
ncbi:hypothetical protein [uncultured Gammaproteobacteria bacterium]|nr:hypothetical protein [uncultured Gammaproteobacteria bacterium]CAC9634100.1 hypothetical protein [uncultured Gammaproteobacteria bacterium]CAC9656577.1 hypothetical protein [uncultured Gammaproteobacteria bacterium]